MTCPLGKGWLTPIASIIFVIDPIRLMWKAPKGDRVPNYDITDFFLSPLVAIKLASLGSRFLCKIFNMLVNHF